MSTDCQTLKAALLRRARSQRGSLAAAIVEEDPSFLRRLRALAGWSQERLAEEVGVNGATVAWWETSRSVPRPDVAADALSALVSAADLSKLDPDVASFLRATFPPKPYTRALAKLRRERNQKHNSSSRRRS